MRFQNEFNYLCALRGATTCENNSVESITTAVEELLTQLVSRNNLIPDQIISVTFSVTTDLDACFPASVARKKTGWEKIALLDCQQMSVKGDLSKCIRLLAYVWLPKEQTPQNPYIARAKKLRPDR
ncbi:chorismate mutase [Prochlorococcus marinus]|uniref:chorismate mutase n=1 Tax=Prochlorococcus marinus XMU1408 TaxID=2213228 RepID=A0A318R2M5_PROMR|nr:chorismate mutase [Prochlorococcus marinus]MBW3042418.1 chorismate mutase [Prochlorococcus marinus str. XMU1408]PYE01150.1 chorismate mutase [Prochlorococcus marinus XMU1408]